MDTPAEPWQQVLELALQLPSIDVGTAYGTPALRVHGKLMARLLEDRQTLVIKTNLFTRQYLLEAEPRTFFLTDHYRGYPYVLVRLEAIRTDRLRDQLEEAWRLVAPKRLIITYDAAR